MDSPTPSATGRDGDQRSVAGVRVLLLSDTHLGLDLPLSPRTERPRRGDDLFANFERALAPALRGEADLVIHGGDVFYRSRVALPIVARAAEALAAVARAGVPVALVPGNHERSRLPYPLVFAHPGIHVFHRPRTVEIDVRGIRVALAGFPYTHGIRGAFPAVLRAAASGAAGFAGVRLLCMHHAVEGATVGPGNFTFRRGDDVVRTADLPHGFAAVLSGHIHRAQVLRRSLEDRPLHVPVIYPGSIERISFAEQHEPKGAAMVEVSPNGSGGVLRRARLLPLPARPMVDLRVDAGGLSRTDARATIAARCRYLPPRSIVRMHIGGTADPLSQAELRELLPPDALLWSNDPYERRAPAAPHAVLDGGARAPAPPDTRTS